MDFLKSWSFTWGLRWIFERVVVCISDSLRTTHGILDFLVSLDASLNILQFLRRRQECHMSRLHVIKDLLFATDAHCVAHGNHLWSLMVFKNHKVRTKKSQGALWFSMSTFWEFMIFLILREGRLSPLYGVEGGIYDFRGTTSDLLWRTYDPWSGIYAKRKA